jgi:hypothetical protein
VVRSRFQDIHQWHDQDFTMLVSSPVLMYARLAATRKVMMMRTRLLSGALQRSRADTRSATDSEASVRYDTDMVRRAGHEGMHPPPRAGEKK